MLVVIGNTNKPVVAAQKPDCSTGVNLLPRGELHGLQGRRGNGVADRRSDALRGQHVDELVMRRLGEQRGRADRE